MDKVTVDAFGEMFRYKSSITTEDCQRYKVGQSLWAFDEESCSVIEVKVLHEEHSPGFDWCDPSWIYELDRPVATELWSTEGDCAHHFRSYCKDRLHALLSAHAKQAEIIAKMRAFIES